MPVRRAARARLALPALAAAALAACAGSRPEPAGCDLGRGPCAGGAGGTDVRLEISPRPIRSLRDLEVAAVVSRGGAPLEGAEVALELSMPGMYMGENRVALAPLGGGRYRGKAVLVRCASGRRDWVAEVVVRLPAGEGGDGARGGGGGAGEDARTVGAGRGAVGEPAALRVRFPFEVAE